MEWTIRELQYFVTAADAGSFTDAAARLFVSQAAVSRTIASLETRIGDRVLRRVPRGCELTSIGQQLLPQARRVLAEAAKFTEFVSNRESTLRLGYSWAALGQHTTPLQRGWADAQKAIRLELIRHNTPMAGLAEGMCDVAIVRGDVDEKRFDSVIVGLERRLVAFASDDSDWARRRVVRLSDIATRTVVIDPRTGTTNSGLWTRSGEQPAFVAVTDVNEWLDSIAAGHGVGVTAEATAHHHPRAGVTYLPVKDGPRIPVRLAWWRDDPTPGLMTLIDSVTALYADR
jgi:DNA-binding transcriptional LysR family regulator